ncbi:unnamed protein product (macronuclear) [Paramecium tetraurelia]|uniref:Uncharacterized protein n=1 Tax=Paramecium tetraurelia TaxID=5888 RepID=A0CAU6_PARTE|nr:uncharacterized protein GSPATT00036694001 [Paramecium tetraurelia]CAK67913.1 unnamed protein product [Paramecium tetraurelia]|eukprot:XP_001435310.1 hypothetical protein (macronuclear) [Paramecium tetraurelia strain d4-2]
MNNTYKFYYGEDLIEKTKEYQLTTQTTRIARSKSENRKMVNSITKYSNSATSKSHIKGLENITEYHQNPIGQMRIMKRRKLILQKEVQNSNNSQCQLTNSTKIKIIQVHNRESQKSTEKRQLFSNQIQSHLNSFDNQQQFLQSLIQKDLNLERINKLVKIRLGKSQVKVHSHQRSQNTEVSSEKHQLATQSSNRRQRYGDSKDIRQFELKVYIYKLILTFEYTCQIWKGNSKLEHFLEDEQKFVGFMNFTYNLTNLPLNIEGLAQLFKGTQYLIKTLKSYIPQKLENLIFEDSECQKLRQLTFQYQVFYILNNHSVLIDNFTNQTIRFMLRQSKECSDLQYLIEKQFLSMNLYDIDEIQCLFEKQFNQPYELLLNEAKSFCNLVIEYDYVKQLYCFCIKVQDTLSDKIKQEGNRKQVYDKGFDFKTAMSKIKSKEMNHEKLLAQLVPQKHDIIQKLDMFECKFGQFESISNLSREYAKLGDMKYNQLYERILKLQKQME